MIDQNQGGDLLKPESLSVRLVSETRQTFGTEAARQLWFKLKLPIVPAMSEANTQLDLFAGGGEIASPAPDG